MKFKSSHYDWIRVQRLLFRVEQQAVGTELSFGLTSLDIEMFEKFVAFANRNPRKVKRITNILCMLRGVHRAFLGSDVNIVKFKGFHIKLMAWVFLCEQWPVRVCFLLRILEDILFIYKYSNDFRRQYILDMKFSEFFKEFVQQYIFDVHRDGQWPKDFMTRLHGSLNLDSDGYSFDALLDFLDDPEFDLTISDIGNLDEGRDNDKLLTFTFNLNPALGDLVKQATAFREDEEANKERRLRNYTYHSKREPTAVLYRTLHQSISRLMEGTGGLKQVSFEVLKVITRIKRFLSATNHKNLADKLSSAISSLQWIKLGSFSKGDEVDVNIGGLCEWYAASITRHRANGTYDISYCNKDVRNADGGNTETRVDESMLRFAKEDGETKTGPGEGADEHAVDKSYAKWQDITPVQIDGHDTCLSMADADADGDQDQTNVHVSTSNASVDDTLLNVAFEKLCPQRLIDWLTYIEIEEFHDTISLYKINGEILLAMDPNNFNILAKIDISSVDGIIRATKATLMFKKARKYESDTGLMAIFNQKMCQQDILRAQELKCSQNSSVITSTYSQTKDTINTNEETRAWETEWKKVPGADTQYDDIGDLFFSFLQKLDVILKVLSYTQMCLAQLPEKTASAEDLFATDLFVKASKLIQTLDTVNASIEAAFSHFLESEKVDAILKMRRIETATNLKDAVVDVVMPFFLALSSCLDTLSQVFCPPQFFTDLRDWIPSLTKFADEFDLSGIEILFSNVKNVNPTLKKVKTVIYSHIKADEDARKMKGENEDKGIGESEEEEPRRGKEVKIGLIEEPSHAVNDLPRGQTAEAVEAVAAVVQDDDQLTEILNAYIEADEAKKELFSAGGAIKDDKSGRDFMGITALYAHAIAVLILRHIDTPYVFGLYAQWGSGKSFLMTKVISEIQFGFIVDVLRKRATLLASPSYHLFSGGFESKTLELKEISECITWLENNKSDDMMSQIDACIKWNFDDGILNLISTAATDESKMLLLKGNLEETLDNRSGDFDWVVEIFIILFKLIGFRLILFKILYFVVPELLYEKLDNAHSVIEFLVIIYRFFKRQGNEIFRETDVTDAKMMHLKTIRKCWQHVTDKGTNNNNDTDKKKDKLANSSDVLDDGDPSCPVCHMNTQNNSDNTDSPNDSCLAVTYTYEYVWFNAWLYSGSDNLWAGLIHQLHHTVENHYGRSYTYAQRLAQLHIVVVKVLMATSVFCGGIAIFVTLQEEINSFKSQVIAIVLAIVSTSAGLAFSVYQIYAFFSDSSKKSARMAHEVEFSSIKNKLGYMANVKKELSKIAEYLEHPDHLPTYWDYILSEHIKALFPWLVKRLNKSSSSSSCLPCRLVIFVDDLDRCPPDKCVEVLRSLVLLLEGSPFILFLAVDPRVVVAAIEGDNAKFFKDAQINGSEYLDKIVQMPFALPPLTNAEKKMLVQGFLNLQEFNPANDAVTDGSKPDESAGYTLSLTSTVMVLTEELKTAVSIGDTADVDILMQLGRCNINAIDERGCTALHIASCKGSVEVVKLLIEAKAHLDLRDKDGKTAHCLAAERGLSEIAQLLVHAGAQITYFRTIQSSNMVVSPELMKAAEKGDVARLESLLEEGVCSANAVNSWVCTPLHFAASNGSVGCLGPLLAAGADPNAKNQWGQTPLHDAANYGKDSCIGPLLAAGADPKAKNNEGKTPLQMARQQGKAGAVAILSGL